MYSVEWEKLYDKGLQTESLTRYIARKQAVYLLEILINDGWDEKKAKEGLVEILKPKNAR